MHMRRRLTLLLVTATLALAPACTKVYTDDDRNNGAVVTPTPLPTPTPTPAPVVKTDRIEFRVLGAGLAAFTPVIVRHTDAVNGLTLYAGATPYFVQFDSTESTVFLYIEASGSGSLLQSTLQVQIYVNGKLFREGYAQGVTLSATASGTYRR